MSYRVTERDMYAALELFQASVGDTWQYGIDSAYGGHKIVRYDPSGGQWNVSDGYGTKRETLDFINAMLSGISEYTRDAPKPKRAEPEPKPSRNTVEYCESCHQHSIHPRTARFCEFCGANIASQSARERE